jgi:hypothetical protein
MNRVIMGVLTAVLVTALAIGIIAPIPAQAAAPAYPGNVYISEVRVGNPTNPLDYHRGGMSILLTSTGCSVGKWWSGATALARFAIDSWVQQTGRPWPYHWRSFNSVASEILGHCYLFGRYNPTTRPLTVSFSSWYW